MQKNEFFSGKKRKKEEVNFFYFFLRYGRPVLLFTPTTYPVGKSQGVPLFGVLLLK
jgi:hypothetical protein